MDCLDLAAYKNMKKRVPNRMVDMYHSSVDKGTEERIKLSYADSTIRVLVSTTAFGMGVDVPNIRHIIHWGPKYLMSNVLAGGWSMCQG